MTVATGNQAEMDGSGLGASFTAAEEPVLSTDCQTTQRSFGCAIVDRQFSIGGIANERLPVLEQVIHRSTERCLGHELGLFRFQPSVQRRQYRHRALLAHLGDSVFPLLTW